MFRERTVAAVILAGLVIALGSPLACAAERRADEPPDDGPRYLTPGEISPGYRDMTTWQVLMTAIGAQDAREVRSLLAAGLDPNAADPESGLTPLMIADSLAVADALLDHGADVNRRDAAGATALHHAVFASDAVGVVQRLLTQRPEVDAVAAGDGGQTPLLLCRQHFFEGNDAATGARLLRILTEAGASINAADDLGYTVLMTAAANDKPELARLALELGAEPELRPGGGPNALELAREYSPRVAEILAAAPGEDDG